MHGNNSHFVIIPYNIHLIRAFLLIPLICSELNTSTCELELVSSLSGQVQSLLTTKTVVTSLTVCFVCFVAMKNAVFHKQYQFSDKKLYLIQVDGAAWKDNKIVLNLPEFGSPSIIKNLTITYTTKSIHNDKHIVELPLYSNSMRSTFICSLKVTAGASYDSVILSGAALVVADL